METTILHCNTVFQNKNDGPLFSLIEILSVNNALNFEAESSDKNFSQNHFVHTMTVISPELLC